MNYGAIKNCDIANGTGVRVSLFVSGCRNHCKGCFQPETWDFCYGKPFTEDTANYIIDLMAPDYINGLTILGGDPFEPENQKALLPFLKKVRNLYPQKNIWMYTGYTWEQLTTVGQRVCTAETKDILGLIDILVDGPFIQEKKNLRLKFRGSENQRIIDVKGRRHDDNIGEHLQVV
ncbi:MAG: anaerobic ribonucleoside-triphosphate reductase activating protein [Pseudobutyrivibrio sp.]|nr:anaerobic ribonucleoside-triphosphate reductase activating protein [Pseudobutyrivibrio sp.]